MSTFYRVHAWLPDASPGKPGHPLYVHPKRSAGRIDNPDYYDAIYVADSAAGAIAEVFASHHTWTPDLLAGPPYLGGSVRALTTYSAELRVMDLNDPEGLLKIGQRPSRVVTRHRKLTQAWALGIFHLGEVEGVSWWSYHDPDWASLGIWDMSGLQIQDTVELKETTPAFVEARAILGRPWAEAI